MVALLKEKEGGFAVEARPYVEGALTEHTRFGDSDPRDEPAALIRKASTSCLKMLSGEPASPSPRPIADDAQAVVDRPAQSARGSLGGEEQAEATEQEGVPPPAAAAMAKAETRQNRALSEPGSGVSKAGVVDYVGDISSAPSARDERVKQVCSASNLALACDSWIFL